jgi:hypothetical protein
MAAFAGTINIPHFNDGGGQTNASFFPGPGESATWISITNTTNTDKTITVNFYTLEGVANGSSTGALLAHRSAGFRPVAQDTFESALGTALAPPTNPLDAGWCQILFPGGASDIAGKANTNVGSTSSQFAWTLIPYD